MFLRRRVLELKDRLLREHHSSWTWAHSALSQLLGEIGEPDADWRQTGTMRWEGTTPQHRLVVEQSADGRWSWSIAPSGIAASGIEPSMPDAMDAAERAAE